MTLLQWQDMAHIDPVMCGESGGILPGYTIQLQVTFCYDQLSLCSDLAMKLAVMGGGSQANIGTLCSCMCIS